MTERIPYEGKFTKIHPTRTHQLDLMIHLKRPPMQGKLKDSHLLKDELQFAIRHRT